MCNNGLWTGPLIIYLVSYDFLCYSTALLSRMFIFLQTFTWTNYTRVSVSVDCTRVSHKTNTSVCRNSTVSPKLSRFTSSSRWTWARGPLILHSWSETTLTDKMAFLGISIHLFQKKYYQHVRNAVLDVCAKSVPVWSKIRDMRGLLRG